VQPASAGPQGPPLSFWNIRSSIDLLLLEPALRQPFPSIKPVGRSLRIYVPREAQRGQVRCLPLNKQACPHRIAETAFRSLSHARRTVFLSLCTAFLWLGMAQAVGVTPSVEAPSRGSCGAYGTICPRSLSVVVLVAPLTSLTTSLNRSW